MILSKEETESLSLVPKRKNKTKREKQEYVYSLLSLKEIPNYLKVNPYILSGYRREMSIIQAFRTIFMWHNEILNIWSHIIGIGIFVFSLLFIYKLDCHNHSKIPLLIFNLAAIYTLSISTLYHTCLCISSRHFEYWRKMDFVAIILIMLSTFFPICFYFFINKLFTLIYLTISCILTAICICIVLLPFFQENKFHVYRPFVFGIIFLFGIFVVTHSLYLHYDIYPIRIAIITTITMFAFIITGALFYILRFPESRIFYKNYIKNKKDDQYKFVSIHGHFFLHLCVLIGLCVFNYGNIILLITKNN